jgi:ATP-dependent exoDNAse (exonuclease V) alpha subunit
MLIMEELSVKITGIVFSNKQTGFYIFKGTKDDGKPITVRGSFVSEGVDVGLKVKVKGVFENHEKFGLQFVSNLCEIVPDKGRIGVVAYLVANVPSIGPITASRLYEALGDDLLPTLEDNPEKLYELPFLNKNQVEAIIKEWSTSSEGRTASIFLSELGLGSYLIKSVFSKFGLKGTKELIISNPYRLVEVSGIGFHTADAAARKVGIGVDDDRRAQAMILHSMSELSFSEGHLFCSSDQIRDFIDTRLFRKGTIDPFSHGRYISDSHLYKSIVELTNSGLIVAKDQDLYLVQNHVHEHESAASLSDMITNSPVDFGDLDSILSEFESSNTITLSDEQRF